MNREVTYLVLDHTARVVWPGYGPGGLESRPQAPTLTH